MRCIFGGSAEDRDDGNATTSHSLQSGTTECLIVGQVEKQVAVAQQIRDLRWQVILYAALSLTLVRMVPVAIAFAGRGVKRPTVAFIGWFGPRGLASLVFALLALERGVPEGEVVLTTVVVTVALSVVLHGLTSVPLVTAYHRWYEAHTAGHPAAEEATRATLPRRADCSEKNRLCGHVDVSARGDDQCVIAPKLHDRSSRWGPHRRRTASARCQCRVGFGRPKLLHRKRVDQ